ncbi:MAG: glutamate racemase, partial [Bacteroidota bacterium]
GENIIYFGDTAHLPYGDKSKESIISFSKKIAEFLLSRNAKMILIACNSSSANAYQAVKEYVGDNAIVIDAIDPVVQYIKNIKEIKKLGVIGTKSTISSRAYEQKLKEAVPLMEVRSMATPLFVPMIEEGFIYDDISNAIIRSYLSKEELGKINALILGCTHYPIIKNQISKYYDFNVEIFDSALVVANYARDILANKKMINQGNFASQEFFVSDYTDYFEKISRMFFEEKIILSKLNLWE